MIERYERAKEVYFRVSLAGIAVLIMGFCLKAIPRLNDAISGQPAYMRYIADRVARSIASRYGDESAVIVVSDERADCRKIQNADVSDPAEFFYVVRYSEASHSLCFVTYTRLPDRRDQANSLVLHPETGHNFGQLLKQPVRVVPISQLQMVYPLAYLSLLHWRAEIDSTSFKQAANAKFERWFASSAEPGESLSVEIDFPSLRADVGRRHRLVNLTLSLAMWSGALLISFAAYRVWKSYVAFGALLAHYHRPVSFRTYLTQDLRAIAECARRSFQEEREYAMEQGRATAMAERSREAVRGRLESILSAVSDDQARLRVQEYLAHDDIEEMKALADEMQGLVGHQSTEEKLTTLLGSLKEYCGSEEYGRFCKEAFQILEATDFRQARGFVVDTHTRLRARLKELEERKIAETDNF